MISILMKTILSTALFVFLFVSCDYCFVKESDLIKTVEMAYFEGQRDALENDIRIKRSQDSCWIWTRSPWDDDTQPVFDPSFNCR